MSNCLNCGNKLVHTEGRRQKKYCNEKCRVAHYQKEHKQKTVSFKSFQELKAKFDAVVGERDFLKARINPFDLLGILPSENGEPTGTSNTTLKLQMMPPLSNEQAVAPHNHKQPEQITTITEIKPIEAPKKEKATKVLPPATRHEPVAHKQATDELAAILDEPRPIDGLITREEYSKLRWQEQAAYSIKFKKQFKK